MAVFVYDQDFPLGRRSADGGKGRGEGCLTSPRVVFFMVSMITTTYVSI